MVEELKQESRASFCLTLVHIRQLKFLSTLCLSTDKLESAMSIDLRSYE